MAKQVNSADAFDLVAPATENREETVQDSVAQPQAEVPRAKAGDDKKKNPTDEGTKTTVVIPTDVAAALAVAKTFERKSRSKIISEALVGYLTSLGYYKPQ